MKRRKIHYSFRGRTGMTPFCNSRAMAGGTSYQITTYRHKVTCEQCIRIAHIPRLIPSSPSLSSEVAK